MDYFDRELTGFLLEVRAAGGRTYHQRYRDQKGRIRQVKIGLASQLTLDQARQKGRDIVAAVILGSDPQDERVTSRSTPTLSEFILDRYVPFVSGQKKSWRIDERHFRLNILPTLGQFRLDEITHEHVANLLLKWTEGGFAPGTRNRALSVLQHAYHLAKKWKVPGSQENPAQGIPPAYEPIRQKYLSPDEVRRFVQAAAEEANRPAANILVLLLLTGGRCEEIRQVKWSLIDWTARTLLVPISESGRPRTIALNSAALNLLRSIKPTEGTPYVFPGVTGRPPELTYPFRRVCRKAGISGIRIHDLRHTFASLLVNDGVSLFIVQGLLGHTHARTTQRYAHLAARSSRS